MKGKINDEEYNDYAGHNLMRLSKEELCEEVLNNQTFAIETICKFDWIFGAFMLTLMNDFGFGKQRMHKVLKGVQERFSCFNGWTEPLSFSEILEEFGFQMFFHNGKVLLRDLKMPADEYFDDLSTDLRSLARKIELSKPLDKMTEKEQKALKVLREIYSDN